MSSFEKQQTRVATASLNLWYAMLWCFFHNTESGVYVFLNTALFSQKMSVGTLSGTPNMRRLYCNAVTNSTTSLSTVKLDPKVNILTKFCFLLSHITGSWLQNINMTVCDCLVTFYDARSSSSNSAWTSVCLLSVAYHLESLRVESVAVLVCPHPTSRAFLWKCSPILMSKITWHLISW